MQKSVSTGYKYKRPEKPCDAKAKAAFLRFYGAGAYFTTACHLAGTTTTGVYRTMEVDLDFKAAADMARECWKESLEREAYRRAIIGLEEPVYYMGKQVGTILKRDAHLLIMLLKAYRPGKYRGNTNETVNAAGGALALNRPITEELWRYMARKVRKEQHEPPPYDIFSLLNYHAVITKIFLFLFRILS